MTRGSAPQNPYYAGDLYGELALLEDTQAKRRPSEYFPGLLIAGVAALAAGFLNATYGLPLILAGLLLGLALTFVARHLGTHPGLDLASGPVLRVGIVLLGFQVTAAEIVQLGAAPFAGVVIVMGAALAGALLCARLAQQKTEAGVLAGGATAICGASAALALYGVIGDRRISRTYFTVSLMGVTAASAIALVSYPLAAEWLQFSDKQAGFLTGAAIHDVAQSIGGGYSISDEAGRYATVVKLSRVALLAPLVAVVAFLIRRSDAAGEASLQNRPPLLPTFIVLFFLVLTINSVVSVPETIRSFGLTTAKAMLVLAVIATAMRSQLGLLLDAGWRSFVPVAGATVASFATALLAAFWIV